ncbi:hypothetical protein D7U36_09240 [Propionibacterium australiense]|uniref:NADP-dependent oxidoreductase domain-containing protein n=2 Tax=Propionibacterium australiense TaxID=119981 RepID=A0A8B3FIF6_9ACTN|nr:hypothetical protein D7U36_09240 [Propionibacterium australiense]
MTSMADDAHARMQYRTAGRYGPMLPVLSLGMWQNFGDRAQHDERREIVLAAFEAGVTHLDLAPEYGPPAGAAEEFVGSLLATEFAGRRDELTIATKAHGTGDEFAAGLDASLGRLGTDHVDVLYAHCPGDTPAEHVVAALDAAVQTGRARSVGVSGATAEQTRLIADVARATGTPLSIAQHGYSLFDRRAEGGARSGEYRTSVIDECEDHEMGFAAGSPLFQGLLTHTYRGGAIPERSRAAANDSFPRAWLTHRNMLRIISLEELARRRGQTVAQLVLAWVLYDERVTTAVMGVRSLGQLNENLAVLGTLDFDDAELSQIEPNGARAGCSIT